MIKTFTNDSSHHDSYLNEDLNYTNFHISLVKNYDCF